MPCRLLVIDDSKVMRALIRRELHSLLAHKEHEIAECANGKDALDRCQKESFDLIFSDLTMPEMTGYQLLEKLQQYGMAGKVVVLSADIQSGAVERVRALGAVAFLHKPINRDAIQAILTERHIL